MTDLTPPAAVPDDVAAEIAALPRPTLIVFDCDGVLAPIVSHADDSVLVDGVFDQLATIAGPRVGDVQVAVLSGRSLEGLAQFEFPHDVIVVGSYGDERRGHAAVPLSDAEASRLERLDSAVVDACEMAGEGAWIERKPASIVLHVFEADPTRSREALDALAASQSTIDGSLAHEGHQVLEVMARPTDKGTALAHLQADESPAAVVYFGDDIPDEAAFGVLGPDDLGVKVGSDETVANRRLADPDAVCDLLTALAALYTRP